MKYTTDREYADSRESRAQAAGLALAITRGWLWEHESGTYVKKRPAGADLFAWNFRSLTQKDFCNMG
jgi:hypothetical protein